MIKDCVVDTHILAEIIKQFDPRSPNSCLRRNSVLRREKVSLLNKIIESDGYYGKVVSSVFAIIEIYNQFEKVSNKEFDSSKLYGFITQPPEWFVFEDLNLDTLTKYIFLPKYSNNNDELALEDAIHIATTFQRGPNNILITNDRIIHDLVVPEIEII